ncbi:MAG: hypothetical protein ACRDA5_06590 [Clostridium sp.]
MKKSEWSKPEVVSLGVSKTTLDDKANGRGGINIIYVCGSCHLKFRTYKLAQEHETSIDGHYCYTEEGTVELS